MIGGGRLTLIRHRRVVAYAVGVILGIEYLASLLSCFEIHRLQTDPALKGLLGVRHLPGACCSRKIVNFSLQIGNFRQKNGEFTLSCV